MAFTYNWLDRYKKTDSALQNTVLKNYLEDRPEWGLRHMAKELKLSPSRTFRIISLGDIMTISEFEKFNYCLEYPLIFTCYRPRS